MTTEELSELMEMFKTPRQTGFILIPDGGSFQVYEVDKERLKQYMMIESMGVKNIIPPIS